MDLFIWFPIVVIAACLIAGLIIVLAEASKKVDRLVELEESNVYDFPTRTPMDGGDGVA